MKFLLLLFVFLLPSCASQYDNRGIPHPADDGHLRYEYEQRRAAGIVEEFDEYKLLATAAWNKYRGKTWVQRDSEMIGRHVRELWRTWR